MRMAARVDPVMSVVPSGSITAGGAVTGPGRPGPAPPAPGRGSREPAGTAQAARAAWAVHSTTTCWALWELFASPWQTTARVTRASSARAVAKLLGSATLLGEGSGPAQPWHQAT